MKDVTVKDVQGAIATLHAWANGSGYLPDAPADLISALANLLEQLLVHRDELEED